MSIPKDIFPFSSVFCMVNSTLLKRQNLYILILRHSGAVLKSLITRSFFFSFILVVFGANAQFTHINWQRSLGGSANEIPGTATLNSFGSTAASVAKADGTNYYVVASTNSNDGFVSASRGGEDVWLLKLNADGDTLWTRNLGGSNAERAFKVRSLAGGGCVVVGQTLSNNGDFTGNHGLNDGFLVKLNDNGDVVWKKLYGGSALDFLYDVVELANGDLVACGDTGSNDGDLTGTGTGLCWVLWVNGSNGNVLSSRAYSSPNAASPDYIENFTCIQRLSDGSGFILSGFSTPNFNDFNQDDIFVAKINTSGFLQWTKLIGSTTAGDGSAAILDADSGEFYIAGRLSGAFPGVTYHGGNGDAWLIKCDSSGNILWSKNYGGTNWDSFTDAVKDEQGNLLFSGFTRSTDQLLADTEAKGLVDFWIVKTDADGEVLSQKRIGGSENDFALGLALGASGTEVVVAGRSESNNGDVSGNNGGRDLWVVKMSDTPTSLMETVAPDQLSVYPNPCSDLLQIYSDYAIGEKATFDVLTTQGSTVLSVKAVEGINTLSVRELSAGTYILRLSDSGNLKFVRTIVILR